MWGGCWLVWSASWALKWSCLPLSPIVSSCLPSWGWVLVGVVGFLGSEVVLSPVVSLLVSLHVGGGCWLVWSASWALKWSCLPLSPVVSGCLPSCGGWVLVGVVGFLGSEVVLSPVVSHCLRLSPFMWGACWLVWSAVWALKWSCLPLSPVVSLHVGSGCWLVWPPSWALKWSCLPLSPIVSSCLPSWVLVGVAAILGSEVVLSPVVSHCLRLSPFMWGVGVGWCGRLLGLSSRLLSRCLPSSPLISLHVGSGCWLVWSASWALKWSCPRCLPLFPVVSLVCGSGCWLVWSASWALKCSCLPLSPVVSFMWGWVLVGVVAFLASQVVLSAVVFGCLPSCGIACLLVW